MALASAAPAHELAAYRAEFPICARSRYLNTCSLGALSVQSQQAVRGFLEVWAARGAAAWYDVWWDALAALRAQYAEVIGASPGEIALHASVSSALGTVASALETKRRPKVVTTSLDFPTIAYQFLAKARQGVEVVMVESPDGVTVPVERLAAAVDERTALVATSHVYFTTGAVQDIAAVAEVAHRCGAFCFVDAYQSVGQIPVDVHTAGVDFLCAGGLKWLLGGPGIVFLYARRDVATALEPTLAGWFGHREQFAFDPARIQWFDDARRFELGTPALAAVYAQLGGIEVLRKAGLDAVQRVTARLREDLIERALAAGLRLRVSGDPERRSAIVPVAVRDPQRAVRRLADARVIADARPGHVRLSPYFYNVPDDYAEAIEILRAL